MPNLLLRRPDIVHLQFATPWKRNAGALLGRLAGARIVLTVHAQTFDLDDPHNQATLRRAHGIIVLNPLLHRTLSAHPLAPRIALMTPVFAAPQKASWERRPSDHRLRAALTSLGGRRIALIYAYARDIRNGVETYGLHFVASLLPRIAALGFTVVFVDPSAQYTAAELDPHQTGAAVHLPYAVDFYEALDAADVYLRPTSTDGNSVAVLEALTLGTPVLASDAVPRPHGVRTYAFGDAEAFLDALRSIKPAPRVPSPPALTPIEAYVTFLHDVCRTRRPAA
jgi:hypothetical protein